MKKCSVIFLSFLVLLSVMFAVPMVPSAEQTVSYINASFENDDTTTWTTLNNITVSKINGGADGSGTALRNYFNKGGLDFSFKDYGAASFAFAPTAERLYMLSVDVKLVTCASTTPTTVSFVLKNSSGKESVVPAELNKALSTSQWSHCIAYYTATDDIQSLEVRIGKGKISENGKSSGSILKSYTFEFHMDNLLASPVSERSDALAMDFDEGWFPTLGTISGNSNVSWTSTDTLNESAGAIDFTTTANYGSVRFPLRTAVGNSYEISLWVKPKETPASQKAYFNIYSPSEDGKYSTWNTVDAKHNEDFKADTWTLCTATYVPSGKGVTYIDGVRTELAVTEKSEIEFRLGNGIPAEVMNGTISFAMDDFFVFPQVDNKNNPKERISNGGMLTQEAYDTSWAISSSNTATITWQAEGANGTEGSVQVQVLKDWGTLRTKNTVEMEFGSHYELTFWAKAVSEDAVGLDMYAYLMYNGHKTHDETPKWVITRPSREPTTLSKEWQKYSILFVPNSSTPEKIYPYVYFRAGEGTETVTFAIDEVSVIQKGDSNFDVSSTCTKAMENDDLFLQIANSGNTRNYFIYRMIQELNGASRVLATKKTTENFVHIPASDLPENGNIRFEVVGVDAYNKCSRISSCKVVKIPPKDTITLTNDQYIWTKDLKHLSGTVRFDNKTAGRTLKLVGAQYDSRGALLTIKELDQEVGVGEKQEWEVSFPVEELATKAKFFAWFSDSLTPAAPVSEICKTTNGKFIYLDANSTATTENGSYDKPYRTFEKARLKLRDHIANAEESDIYMIFKSGEYVQPNYGTISLTNEEYSMDKNVIFTTLEGEKAQITGAKHISGRDFELYDEEKNIYRVAVEAGISSRQLYVDGLKAIRARSPEDAVQFTNLDHEEYQAATDEAPYVFNNLGLTSTDLTFAKYKYPQDLEINFIENWRHQFICPDAISESTDKDGNPVSHFTFAENGNKALWNNLVTLNTPARIPVYVENAYELLDEEGEWYLDTHESFLYYIPRSFERMDETTDVVIPMQSKLLCVKGTPDAHARNITFKNIDFAYTTWNYPTEKRSFRNNQNAFFSNPEGGSLLPGAVEIYDASNITFDNCDFSRIGSLGLKMTGAIQYSNVIGNEFYEISGNALALGDVTHADNAHKNQIINPTHRKYYVTDNLIANNYIHKVATDYYSAAAVSVGFPVNTTIRNNEITDCPYSGMHTGYGWGSYASTGTVTKNFIIEKNYIHDVLNWRVFDGGGVYMLGATGGTLDNMNKLRRNYFEDVKNAYGAVYPDEGSTYWDVTENVIDQRKYAQFYHKDNSVSNAVWLHIHTTSIQHIHVHQNYSTSSEYRENGKFNAYEEPIPLSNGEWPEEAQQIIEESGIEKTYRNRFDFDIQSINVPRMMKVKAGEETRYFYELVTSKGRIYDTSDIKIEVSSSNPSVATASSNMISGVSEGKAWITLTLTREENGIVRYHDKHSFCVVVE